MPEYRVRYTDKRSHVFEADEYHAHTAYWIFTLGGKEVLNVSRESVESIADTSIPEAEMPQVQVSQQQPRRSNVRQWGGQ